MTKLLKNLDLFTADTGHGNTPLPIEIQSVQMRIPEFQPVTPVRAPASVCAPVSRSKGRQAMTGSAQFALPFDDELGGKPSAAVGAAVDVANEGRNTPALKPARRKSHPKEPDALDRLIAAAPTGEARPTDLEACLRYLAAQPDRPASLLSDARSAVSTVAKNLGTAKEKLPAAPPRLRPLLQKINWAAAGVTQKREANIRSALTSLLLACGWIASEFRAKARHTPEWRRQLDIADEHKLGAALGPFARFCAARSIGPDAVTNDHLLAYEEALDMHSLHLEPREGAVRVQRAWARMQAKEVNWPTAKLALPSAMVWKGCRIGDLPPSFQAELPAYLDLLRHPDPLVKDAGKPLQEISVQQARRAILRAVDFLCRSGHKTLQEVDRLAVVVDPAALRALLLQAYADAGNAWNDTTNAMVTHLLNVARRWVRPDPDVLTALKDMRSMVRVPRTGLSRAVRERLAQFDDPDLLQAFFDLPDRIAEEAERQFVLERQKQAAKLHEVGIMIAILQAEPIRRRTLSELDIEAHFVRDRKGRLARIATTPGILKTPILVDVDLPPKLGAMIERHLKVFRPWIPGHDQGTALFPSPSGGPLSENQVGRRITRVVMQQLGAVVSPHLARHLAVKLLLDDNPENLVVAQRLLGHASPKTTAMIYGVARTSAAQRHYATVVDGLRAAAGKRDAGRKRARKTGDKP